MSIISEKISQQTQRLVLTGDELVLLVVDNGDGTFSNYVTTASALSAGVSFATQNQVDAGTTLVAVSPDKLLERLIFPYDAARAYEADRYVEYGDNLYRIVTLTVAGETPVSHAAKFQLISGIAIASEAEVTTGTNNTKAITPARLTFFWASKAGTINASEVLVSSAGGLIISEARATGFNQTIANAAQIYGNAGGDANKVLSVSQFSSFLTSYIQACARHTATDPDNAADADTMSIVDTAWEKNTADGKWTFHFKGLKSKSDRLTLDDSDGSEPDRVTFALGLVNGITETFPSYITLTPTDPNFIVPAGYDALAYCYDSLTNMVTIRGTLQNNTISGVADTKMTTIPIGYRPQNRRNFVIYHETGSDSTYKGAYINTAGELYIKDGYSQNLPLSFEFSYNLTT